jgi:hypothetical protein
VSSLPLDDGEERGVSINTLFAHINDVLKREITKDIGNETNIEVGDKFKNDKGQVEISVQTFSFGTDKFPVTFKPSHDEGIVEDKEIIPIKGDFEESAVYKLESEDSTEVSDVTTEKPKQSAAVKKSAEATTKLTKVDALLKNVAQQPILTSV